MRDLRDRVDQRLTWRRTRLFGAIYQILAPDADQPVALLEWPRMPTHAIRLTCGDAYWTVASTGHIRRTATIRDARRGTVATCRERFRSGSIELRGGERLEWKPRGFPSREWVLANTMGSPLIRCSPRFALAGLRGVIRIEPAGGSRTDLALLLVTAAYLRIDRLRRAARHSA